MRNRETLRMVLTERDLAALVLVSEFGFVFARQLWGKAWPDTKTISMTYDRLGLMVRAGFLATVSIPGIREKVYTATKEGVSVAQVKHHAQLPKKRPSIRQALHQITLLDLRIKLESLGAKEWGSGRVLKISHGGKDHYHVADAVYFNRNNQKVALEYDRTRRSNERVRKRLEFYASLIEEGAVSGLVYVIEPSLLEFYEQILKAHAHQKVILKTKNQILEGQL